MHGSGCGDRTIVVGAGVAGLACARALADAGTPVTVIERSRGIGGRCITRHIEGQRVDYGVLFYHGRNPDFLAGLEAVPATVVPGWPRVVHGQGRPCQPEAFAPGERRLAFAEGVSEFPKHLARGLDIRTSMRAISFSIDGSALRLELEWGESLSARVVVLALPAEQTLALLHATPEAASVLDTARAILAMVRSQPCLTVVAGYPLDAPAPDWDICYPEASPVLQALARDSGKRPSPAFHTMIYQAHPRWSREHTGAPGWREAILAEAARLLGPWAGEPRFTHAHRWRHASTDRTAELASPLFLGLPGGAHLGLAGEVFAAGGGVEAAWASGARLAKRILAAEGAPR